PARAGTLSELLSASDMAWSTCNGCEAARRTYNRCSTAVPLFDPTRKPHAADVRQATRLHKRRGRPAQPLAGCRDDLMPPPPAAAGERDHRPLSPTMDSHKPNAPPVGVR